MIDSDTSENTYQQVSKKATRSMGWNYLSFGLKKLLNLVSVAILAHLLTPENFGLVALAALTMDYLSIISDLGLGAAIVQRKDAIKESANIAFILNVLAGVLLTILTYFIAPYAALFFRDPGVTPVLRWLGLTFLFGSLGSVHNVLLQRDLNFKKRAIPDVGNSIVKALISIVLALSGFGVWALVIGQLAGTAIGSLLLWIVEPWRPRPYWNTAIAKELLRYGLSIMGMQAITIWEDSFDYLVIGRIYNSTLLGIYSIAYRLPQMLVINVLWVMTAVIFPAFSSLQDDQAALKKIFLTIVRYVEMIVTPICIGMVIAADPIIRVAFGPQWVEAIPVLRALSIYALVLSIGYHVGDIYKAIGRPDILIKLAIPILIIRTLALWAGAQYSILGVSIGHVFASLIALVLQMFVMSRFVKITLLDILKELRAFIAGAVLVVFALPALLLTQEFAPLPRLVIIVIAGAAGYLGSLWFIEREAILKALRMVGIKLPTRDAASPFSGS